MTHRAQVLGLLLAGFGGVASAWAAGPELAAPPPQIGAISFQAQPAGSLAAAAEEGVGRGADARGNPLWDIPLETLQASRERPLFSPSRRPPEPVVALAPAPQPLRQQEVRAPELRLTLVGTAVRGGEGFGIFLDATTNTVVHLKPGSMHDGWQLVALDMRQARLRNGGTTRTLSLPDHGADGLAQPKSPSRTAAGDEGRSQPVPLPR
ncbi:hypothetical protein ABLE93_25050 [Xanthobacter sp. KR7-65]|uniref:hypothetical protein n=1 Tax=Xanthobacter sp. KR7-65 TaxID=3156612 RepID=UPI0032B50C7A